jgi:hypothetical protein
MNWEILRILYWEHRERAQMIQVEWLNLCLPPNVKVHLNLMKIFLNPILIAKILVFKPYTVIKIYKLKKLLAK